MLTIIIHGCTNPFPYMPSWRSVTKNRDNFTLLYHNKSKYITVFGLTSNKCTTEIIPHIGSHRYLEALFFIQLLVVSVNSRTSDKYISRFLILIVGLYIWIKLIYFISVYYGLRIRLILLISLNFLYNHKYISFRPY